MNKFKIIISLGIISAMLGILVGPFFTQVAHATAITSASNVMSRIRVGVLSNHEIRFVAPTATSAGQTITVTFPAGFTGLTSLIPTDYDLATTAGGGVCPGTLTERTVGALPSGVTWGATSTASTITFTSGTDTIAANSCIRIRIGSNATSTGTGVDRIINPGTPGSYAITIGGSFGNSGPITVQILGDDQVAVAATVSQTLSFTLGTTTIALGTLSPTVTATSSHIITLSTNAATGMAVTYAGATLTSGTNTITAMLTGGTSAIGTTQFGINAVANTTPVVGAACSGSAPIAAAATGYGTVNTFRFVPPSGEVIVSSSAAINVTTCTISYIANMAGLTPAGSYTTTLTYIATATF